MNTKDNYLTSYKAAHRFIPTIAFESNISCLDTSKESIPNNPNLKHWNYETTTGINYDFKFDTMDPVQRPTRVNFNKINYMMPQWEKYWLNPPKQMYLPSTEYNDEYIKSKLMFGISQTPLPAACIKPKLVAPKEFNIMQPPTISDMGIVRKTDPYVSTQKLAYVNINPSTTKQLNYKHPKQKRTIPEYEPFYNEPIFNRQNTIRLLPNTMKKVPHNALKTEMSASYKKPIKTLSKFEGTVEMPISISRNPTLSQLLSVPGMYTSEYSKIGGNI